MAACKCHAHSYGIKIFMKASAGIALDVIYNSKQIRQWRKTIGYPLSKIKELCAVLYQRLCKQEWMETNSNAQTWIEAHEKFCKILSALVI